MKFVVTGSTGFVGRNTVRNLLNSGHQVIAVTTNTSISNDILEYIDGSEVLIVNSLNEIPFDILSRNVIVHCAWHNVQNILDNSHFFHAFEQLQFLKKIGISKPAKLIITGTCYEFGTSVGPVSVAGIPLPNTPYAEAKDFVRRAAVKMISEDKNIDFTWARLFYMYGRGQHKKSVYTQLIDAIHRGDKVFNMSGGEQLYDYMGIKQVADALCTLAVTRSPSIVHVCNGYPISLRRLVEEILKAEGCSLTLNLGHYPYRAQDSLAIWGAESFETQIQ